MNKIIIFIRTILFNLVFPIRYRFSLYYIKKVRNKMSLMFNSDNRINVVFLIQFLESWNKLSYLYSRMKEDKRFNPLIVCIPYDHTKFDNINYLDNDVYHYFINNGYDAINGIDKNNKWIDIKELCPAYVFCSRPYNYLMPKEYSSNKLSKYTLIANILYGESFSINIANVVLNRVYYKDVFCYFSLDDSEKKMYEKKFNLGIKKGIQKCEALGRTGLEMIINNKKEKESCRRKVIWNPRWSTHKEVGGSNFFKYKDVMLNLANSFKDVDFIFRPHPVMFNNFIQTGLMSYKEVEEYKDRCKKLPNVILDESIDYVNTFWESDLLISDFSSIVLEYYVTEKPIIYCRPEIKIDYFELGKKIYNSLYIVENEKELIQQFTNWYEYLDENRKQRLDLIKQISIVGTSDRIMNKLIDYLR